jgi:hypothetical protein
VIACAAQVVGKETVRMKKKQKLPNDLIGISGVHFVVSELSRRGLIALPTVKNCAAYDVIVANQRGTKHANLQVKTSFGTRDFWPMPPSTKVRKGPDDHYVFLRWLASEKRFKGYMLPGRELRTCVSRAEAHTKKKGQRPFGAFYVGKRAKGRDCQWAETWEHWQL